MACGQTTTVDVRQLRIYSKVKQWQFRLVLCYVCFGGLFDLIRLSAESMTEGLWSPLPELSRSK